MMSDLRDSNNLSKKSRFQVKLRHNSNGDLYRLYFISWNLERLRFSWNASSFSLELGTLPVFWNASRF
jgi:hypothetical protein